MSGKSCEASSLKRLSMTGVMASPPSPTRVPVVVSPWAFPPFVTSPMLTATSAAVKATTRCLTKRRFFIESP